MRGSGAHSPDRYLVVLALGNCCEILVPAVLGSVLAHSPLIDAIDHVGAVDVLHRFTVSWANSLICGVLL